MKLFLRPFSLFHLFKKSSCQLMAKGCALNTGYLPQRGLPRNSVDRLTDHPDMMMMLQFSSPCLSLTLRSLGLNTLGTATTPGLVVHRSLSSCPYVVHCLGWTVLTV